VASEAWTEHPVITYIDTVSHPMYEEAFPSVTICGKQSKEFFNEWGMANIAFDMIEHACVSQKNSTQKCTFYLQRRHNLINLAGEILEKDSFPSLGLSQIVAMAATKGKIYQ
jgi:hypothetical protein